MKNKIKIYEILLVLLILIGLIVCTISDIIISNTFTWSFIPISSIIFAWVALLPIIKLGKKGIGVSIVILNACIFSYLYVLSKMIKNSDLVPTIGIRMAIISIVYILCIFLIFKILKKRKFAAISASLFAGIPICIVINYNLSKMFLQPVIDIWDILAILTLLILSVLFFAYDLFSKRDKKTS